MGCHLVCSFLVARGLLGYISQQRIQDSLEVSLSSDVPISDVMMMWHWTRLASPPDRNVLMAVAWVFSLPRMQLCSDVDGALSLAPARGYCLSPPFDSHLQTSLASLAARPFYHTLLVAYYSQSSKHPAQASCPGVSMVSLLCFLSQASGLFRGVMHSSQQLTSARYLRIWYTFASSWPRWFSHRNINQASSCLASRLVIMWYDCRSRGLFTSNFILHRLTFFLFVWPDDPPVYRTFLI